jgi:hypothetical protein
MYSQNSKQLIFTACLVELHAALDKKKTSSAPYFFQPNGFSSNNSTEDLLKKMVEHAQIHRFGGVPQGVLHTTPDLVEWRY